MNVEKTTSAKPENDVETTSAKADNSMTLMEQDKQANPVVEESLEKTQPEELKSESLTNKTIEELLDVAKESLVKTPKAAHINYLTIKPLFFEKYNGEKNAAKSLFKPKSEEDEFVFEKTNLVDEFIQLGKDIAQAKAEEAKRIEAEKQANLKEKKWLLATLREIVEQDETLESISRVKEIQKEWKAIRVLPQSEVNALWDEYNALQDKFYDNHSINIELKELDRRKNLEAKIELTKKVEALSSEKSIKRTFIMLNKYHEEFKNIGPVPKISREPIWEAFKKASDAIYSEKRAILTKLDVQKEDNLKRKELLVEKAVVLNELSPTTIKEWNTKQKQLDDLFTEWKKIGPVPKSNNDAAWTAFNEVRNTFYTARKEFFKEINSERKENLKKKEDLCKQVEAIKDSTDWKEASSKIISLQQEWKSIGPVPDKVNNAIWRRFRSACDTFFNAKNKAFAGKREEESQNLVKKEEILVKLDELLKSDIGYKEALAALKEINKSWRNIGFVPHKALKRISSSYKTATNAVYDKFSDQMKEAKESNLKEHYTTLGQTQDGSKTLDFEQRKISKRIAGIKEEIAGIQRNMSFFASSKTADSLLKDFEKKIARLENQIKGLKRELTAINQVRKETQETVKSEDNQAEEAT